MNTLTLALAQVEGHPEPERNLESAGDFCARAAAAGVRLLVFPEMFMALPRPGETLAGVAEGPDGRFGSALAGLAQKHGLYLVSCLWETALAHNLVYNTAVVLSPEGERLAHYRKLHLFDALSVRESDRMRAGDAAPPLVEIEGFRVGLAICYDLRFPELFRSLASRGADLFLVPAAWYSGPLKEDHWLTLLKARALENTCYTAGAGLCGASFSGRSTVVDPFGFLLCDGGEGTGMVTARIERRRLEEVRSKLPSLQHRRRELFP
jgi:predicted amidohydrolase